MIKIEAIIHITGKKAVKALDAACMAARVVAVRVVAVSGAAVRAVVEERESQKFTMIFIIFADKNLRKYMTI